MSLGATARLASKLLSSSVLAQIAVMAAMAVAATRLGPDDFAVYGAVAGLCAILAAVNSWAGEARIAVVGESDAHALLRASGSTVVGISVLVAAAGGIGAAAGHTWGEVALLGAGCALFTGLQQVLTSVVVRTQRQHLLARGRLVQGLSNAALIGVLLLTGMPGHLVLTLPWLVSLLLGDLVLAAGVREQLRVGTPRPADFTLLGREVKAQPLANLLASSVVAMPALLLPALGHTLVAGLWALVGRVLNPIVNTVFNTLQPLYYGRAAELRREGDLAGLARQHRTWAQRMLVFGVPVAVGFFVVSYWLLPLLGEQWRVDLATALAGVLHYTVMMVCLPMSQTLLLLGRMHLSMVWTSVRFVACLLPLLLVPAVGPSVALLGWAGASALTFLWQLRLNQNSIAAETGVRVA